VRRLIAIAFLAALTGCGNDRSESLPTACTLGPEAIVKALARAPAPVTIDDGTPISRCFNRDARGEDEQIVGTNLLAAAQQLADSGRALELGYLIGAARRGARRNGLGTELIRRLEEEPGAVTVRSDAYKRGLRAGLATG
jgi:ketopantoate reductase